MKPIFYIINFGRYGISVFQASRILLMSFDEQWFFKESSKWIFLFTKCRLPHNGHHTVYRYLN
jgi:hypothetical protein